MNSKTLLRQVHNFVKTQNTCLLIPSKGRIEANFQPGSKMSFSQSERFNRCKWFDNRYGAIKFHGICETIVASLSSSTVQRSNPFLREYTGLTAPQKRLPSHNVSENPCHIALDAPLPAYPYKSLSQNDDSPSNGLSDASLPIMRPGDFYLLYTLTKQDRILFSLS